ncbi:MULTISPECIES: plastocyanin/azurin family copper-binding protein [unclassified Pseudomonas]|uniref:cupredoxin domain-containing protein n=1 Tax=unclassified Pseudomonas TaxID=196821 RepID=UPI00244A9F4B|nr:MULTISPECIES: plastocyanin/azurin family copper-binding protein [unclassified Pseudomonas]MDG9924505.1 plastocyanin/azurin family copper-binding protein [Pseudomonas sp. GD04045]MDH0035155.1 plastocyanin/azurin family copper-binding protein [Pseudomonas sp. GD04019]
MSARIFLPLLCAFSLPALADGGHFAFGQPAAAAKADRIVEIVLGDMYYEPAAVQVKAGETVRFVLKNEGGLLHEFSLGDAAQHAEHQKQMLMMQQMGMLGENGIQSMDHSKMGHDMAGMDHGQMSHDDPNTVLIPAGKSAELTWTFAKATGLEFACNLPGHYQAGMVGKLDVQP